MTKGVRYFSNDLLLGAVRNNAEWCELVAHSHGVHSQWLGQAWSTTTRMPPFYPNVVSIESGIKKETVAGIAAELPENCAWKDSFAELELGEYGFKVLFEANWIVLTDSLSSEAACSPASFVTSSGELAEWIAAWGETPIGKTIFLPELLGSKVRFIFCKNGEKISSGLIANHSVNSVGISNCFGDSKEISQCIRRAYEWAKGLPVVSYGSDVELKEMQDRGFKELGDLRVWVR